MPILQIVLTLVFYLWLFLVLIFLWRHAMGGSAHVRQLQGTLIDAAMKSADAAQKSAEAAHTAAGAAHTLALQIESRLDTGKPLA
jgi:hypothetical protein